MINHEEKGYNHKTYLLHETEKFAQKHHLGLVGEEYTGGIVELHSQILQANGQC